MLSSTLISLVVILHLGLQIWVTFYIVKNENLRTATKVGFIVQTWLCGFFGAILTIQEMKSYKAFPDQKF